MPLYVLGVRPAANEVVVGTRDELLRSELTLGDLNWIAEPPAEGDHVEVQIRYRAPSVPAVVTGIDEEIATLRLEEPQRAITPGQSGVVYRGEQLLGGGRIR